VTITAQELLPGIASTGKPHYASLHREAPVTAKREDNMAAATARRGSLRASHADRDQVLDVLKGAFVQGRLTKDEFDTRVGQTLASQTYAELAVLTADIPAGLIRAQPPRKPPRAQPAHPQNKVVNACACAALALFVLSAPLLTGHFVLFFVLAAAMLGALSVAAGQTVHSSHKKRARSQRR
jgi:Domain of unknown function (DUF1707)